MKNRSAAIRIMAFILALTVCLSIIPRRVLANDDFDAVSENTQEIQVEETAEAGTEEETVEAETEAAKIETTETEIETALEETTEEIEIVTTEAETEAEIIEAETEEETAEAETEDIETAKEDTKATVIGTAETEAVKSETDSVAAVLTKTIRTSDNYRYRVTVSYGKSAGIPADATLIVTEITAAAIDVTDQDILDYISQSAEALDISLDEMSSVRLFDISLLGADGTEYQPDEKVSVSIEQLNNTEEFDNVDERDMRIVHFGEEAEELKAEVEDNAVTFETEGFSPFSLVDVTVLQRVINAFSGKSNNKLYENDDIILTGKMPLLGSVEAFPVNVEIEGEDVLVAYDIKIYANPIFKALGITWQPTDGAITVTVKSGALDGKTVNVYHMKDANAQAELVAEHVSTDENSVTFNAESFSVYPVTDATTKPRIFYSFYNGSSVLAAEYITKVSEFYDPGVAPEYGQTFLGWAYNPAETDENNLFSFEELKADLETYWDENGEAAFVDETEIKVYAKFKEAYYLRYMVVDGDGNIGVLKSDSVRTDAIDKTLTVNCDYSGVGEDFRGWIDAKTGTVYQNNDTITLEGHVDLYAKVAGRYWLIFNSNGSGATFTGPQLIYGDHVTYEPSDPDKKGYVFAGWNTREDGTGIWWSKSGDESVNRFGTSISEDVTLYAQWEGAPNSYTVIYWKQKASDVAGLADSDKSYDYIESITVSEGIKTGDMITLPYGYNTKANGAVAGSNYYETYYGGTDWNSDMNVNADGSTVVNVYYDRNAYHLYFQVEGYGYTATTSNSGTQYGLCNGEYVQLYYNNKTWYRTRTSSGWGRYNYSDPYTGTRYIRSNGWQTINDIYALYEHEIADRFPVVGTDGVTYTAARWDPQSNSLGWSEVMSIVYSMPNDSVSFHLDTNSRPTKTVNYYIEALAEDTDTVNAPSVLYDKNNGTVRTDREFVLYQSVAMKYNGVTEEDLLDITGFNFLGTDSKKDSNGFWIYDTKKDGTMNVYYTRKTYSIDFHSWGKNVTENSTQTITEVPYGAKIINFLLSNPENGADGYYFDGWYKDQACSDGLEISEDDIMPDGNAVFYAKWSTYRVRIVLVPGCTDYRFANDQLITFRVDYNEELSFENVKPGVAKRPGYKLTGWYYTPDFREGTEVATDSSYYITNMTPGVDMDYQNTADWTDNTYGDNDGEHESVQGILKLYARWQLDIKEGAVYFLYEVEDGYCIVDNAGYNQTLIPVDHVGHAFETTFQIAEAPEGYTSGVEFTNWMVLNKNGGATSVIRNAGDTVTLVKEEWDEYIDTVVVTDTDGHVANMKVVRLRARFIANEDKSTTIVFYGNGGKMNGGGASYTQVVPLNATIDLEVQSAAFTREHFTLIGWDTEADGTGTRFSTAEQIYADNENLAADGTNKLYAIWQADIEITANGPAEEVIYDGELHSNTEAYTFTYLLGGVEMTEAELNEMGIRIIINEAGWPVAEGTDKGTYTAADLTEAELASLITVDDSEYRAHGGELNIKRVYAPATLNIRDLMLTITKTVTGSSADSNKPFIFTLVSVEGMSEGTFSGTIYHAIEGTTTTVNFTIGGTFWMRDGDIVKIEGLPKGKEIVFSEDNGGYSTTWTLNDEAAISGSSAKITLKDDSTLKVVNHYELVAPTGLDFHMAPFVIMLAAGAVLGLGFLFIRKRD